MSPEIAILLAVALPLVGAIGVVMAGPWPNLRETVTLAVGAAKRALNRGYDLTLEVGMEFESMLFGTMFKTEDMREGTQAFKEKRKPVFKGR